MKRISTFVGKTVFATLLLSLQLLIAHSQCIAPSMIWKNSVLVTNTAGIVGATYVFPEVTPGVHAHVSITDIVGGATLSSIDDTLFGYSNAWQPVVKTPATQAVSESYISFSIKFYNNSTDSNMIHATCDDLHKYDCAQLSFIDIDGDGQHVREFVSAQGYDSYTVANISILTLTETSSGPGRKLKAVGTYANYAGLDTSAWITNVNFNYRNIEEIRDIQIGSITDANFVVQDRYTCGYFQQISMPDVIILPVTYTSFTGKYADKTVFLDWKTEKEINAAYFEVERSFNSTTFKTVGLVLDGLAADKGKTFYKFKDNSAELQGKNYAYYRLKQIDKDGKFNYSTVVAIVLKSSSSNAIKMTVSPNPFVEKVNVQFFAVANGLAELRVLNMNGQTILSKQSTISSGYNSIQVSDLAKLNAGIYIIQLVKDGVVVENKKVVKN